MVSVRSCWRAFSRIQRLGLSRRRLAGYVAGVTAAALLPAHLASASCRALLPPLHVATSPSRMIVADDLLRLRDIGQPQPAVFSGPSPLSVSPDGTMAAFVLTQADPDANRYCRALVLLPFSGQGAARLLDVGGDLITTFNNVSGSRVPLGYPALIRPLWSPDGRSIAYLRQDNGRVQIWQVGVDAHSARPVTHSTVDVQAFAWRADGRALVFSSVPTVPATEQAIEQEGHSGWHYDDRMIPALSARPTISGTLPEAVFVVSPSTGTVVPGTAADSALLAPATNPSDVSINGRRAWTTRLDAGLYSPLRLQVSDPSGKPIACAFAQCDGGFTGVWWDAAGKEVRFLRREGWNKESMALYRWVPGAGPPRRVFATNDVLLGCVMAHTDLLCTRESAAVPRHVVLLDPRTGRSRTVFEPNPEFAAITLGAVIRLHWKNDQGLAAWGDLVLPPGYRQQRGPHQPLPMIVVQYHSNGFLRGGTGDEYPIQLFAQHGFAVLSIEVPPYLLPAASRVTTYDEREVAALRGWAQRRSLLSSLETGVKQVIAMGIADPARIGITGLSDGASTVQFALVNTHLFAAAAISGNAVEPKTIMTYAGTAIADTWRSWGYPPASRDDPAFWKPNSFALNAATMNTPLLIQAAEDEYLFCLESYTALRENRQPVDLYVFPGEHHLKDQPAHRRAIYERNLDWFDFWLQGRREPGPEAGANAAADFRRWKALRDRSASTPH